MKPAPIAVLTIMLGLTPAVASAAVCGPHADAEAVAKAAVVDVARTFHTRVGPGDLYSLQIAGNFAEAIVSPPGGMVSLYYAKRGGIWRRVAVAEVPAASRKAFFPGGDYTPCKNPLFLNRGASG